MILLRHRTIQDACKSSISNSYNSTETKGTSKIISSVIFLYFFYVNALKSTVSHCIMTQLIKCVIAIQDFHRRATCSTYFTFELSVGRQLEQRCYTPNSQLSMQVMRLCAPDVHSSLMPRIWAHFAYTALLSICYWWVITSMAGYRV